MASKPKQPKCIFVFGSNEAGIHGKGAALFAFKDMGAQFGKCYGHHGQSFAIPTKDELFQPLPIERINQYIQGFLAYATGHRKLKFAVSCIGCGLAGFKHEQIAPLFKDAPKNCEFDLNWQPYLGEEHNYWGTFG